MKLPPVRPRQTREPIGPLVDVVFLLLVFFLLAGTLEPPQPIAIELPVSEHADTEDVAPLRIVLDAQGRIGFAGQVLDTESLALAISARKDAEVRRVALVEADSQAPAGAVLALLKQLRALGLEELRLVTRRRGRN